MNEQNQTAATPEQATAYCFECQREQPVEIIDSEPESCGRFERWEGGRRVFYSEGVHMRGYRCLTCGDTEGEPCIHD